MVDVDSGSDAPALALALGLIPGLRSDALAVAARFLDGRSYEARVLEGTAVSVVAPHLESASIGAAVARGVASVFLAVILATGVLGRRRLPAAARRVIGSAWNGAIEPLRRMHTGRIGDYCAWLALGVAVFGCASALLLT